MSAPADVIRFKGFHPDNPDHARMVDKIIQVLGHKGYVALAIRREIDGVRTVTVVGIPTPSTPPFPHIELPAHARAGA
jgi:hypothetical protein